LLSYWTSEFWRLAVLVVAALIIGALVGYPFATVALGLLVYIFWQLYRQWTLARWLRNPEASAIPDAGGRWGEIFHGLYLWRRRMETREQTLGSLLTRFEDAATALPDAVVVLTANDDIEWFNPAAIRLLGLRSRQDVGHPVGNLVRHPDFIAQLNAPQPAAPIQIESPRNENITLNIRIVPYGSGRRLLVARDISRMQHLEQVRRDFVANISHELRTPLTVLTGFLETMVDSEEPGLDSWRESLRTMQDQAARMRNLVVDLLFLARIESASRTGSWEPVAVPAMLAAIREDAVALSGSEHHQIDLDVDETLWMRGNDAELRSAFSNLVVNAVRYTPAGGHIQVRWLADEGGARFAVTDDGIGIGREHLARLTERFYRVDTARSRESGGTGLGLAIVKHVLRRHDAELEIDSTPGEGSTFSCLFPADLVIHHPRKSA
jgi:two-component system phosphate regulon sensor histidine kinase PhoR